MLARVLTVLGWLTIVLGGIGVVAAASESRNDPDTSPALIALVGGLGVALYALIFFGAAALIRLAIRVEDSTFRTAAAVERLSRDTST